MPVHDWTKVDAGIFHDFHHEWISSIKHALNSGILPPNYYAMADQVAGPGNPDVLGLQRTRAPIHHDPNASSSGALLVSEPLTQFRDSADRRPPNRRRKRVAIRHVSGNRVAALIEIVSRGNKSSRNAIRDFSSKMSEYLDGGIHLLVLDLYPPTRRDPNGIHPLIWSQFKKSTFHLPPNKPLTLAAYAGGEVPRAFVETVGVGDALPPMPLFLTPDEYVNVPLEATYQAAWNNVPGACREVIEERSET